MESRNDKIKQSSLLKTSSNDSITIDIITSKRCKLRQAIKCLLFLHGNKFYLSLLKNGKRERIEKNI